MSKGKFNSKLCDTEKVRDQWSQDAYTAVISINRKIDHTLSNLFKVDSPQWHSVNLFKWKADKWERVDQFRLDSATVRNPPHPKSEMRMTLVADALALAKRFARACYEK